MLNLNYIKQLVSIPASLVFMLFTVSLHAANYVTIATIGTRPPSMDPGMGYQQMVDQVKDFWANELKQVLPDQPDLIVLPEACDRPGGLTAEEQFQYYQIRKKQVWDYFAGIARKNRCYLAYGTKWQEEGGTWRNSMVLFDRQGEVAGIYHKNFPTIGEIENGIKPGTETPVFQCDFGTVGGVICYDLNFTELCDRYADLQPDILVFPSMYHGGMMQSYWAYQCRSFFVGALGFREIPSEILNPLGEVLASSTNYFDFVVQRVNLDQTIAHLDNNWGKLRQLKEKYGNTVTISDPGRLGPVLITSEHETVTALQMAREFDIELIDSYFERSREVRKGYLHRTP